MISESFFHLFICFLVHITRLRDEGLIVFIDCQELNLHT